MALMTSISFYGRCLCGAVAYEAKGEAAHADACHCAMCRRWSGHYWASVNVPVAAFRIVRGEENVGWFQSSADVRRGFCRTCGSALFWHPNGNPEWSHMIAISAGSLDTPTGVALTKHIFVASKGDYYEIADGLLQKAAH